VHVLQGCHVVFVVGEVHRAHADHEAMSSASLGSVIFNSFNEICTLYSLRCGAGVAFMDQLVDLSWSGGWVVFLMEWFFMAVA
jgi:hypothetical protein